MASIQDVADQINAKLDSINTSTASTAATSAQTLTIVTEIRDFASTMSGQLAGIDATLAAGFTNLSQGLYTLIELERTTINLLDQNRKQNDTIICELVNNNDLLCGITRKLSEQLAIDEKALVSVRRLEGITERVHADAAADYDRDLAIGARIDACCPPPEVEPEPCPPHCDVDRYSPRRPDGQKWEPLPVRDAIG